MASTASSVVSHANWKHSKRIKSLPASTIHLTRLQKNIHMATTLFLQERMATLNLLPRLSKRSTTTSPPISLLSPTASTVSAAKTEDTHQPSPTSPPPPASSKFGFPSLLPTSLFGGPSAEDIERERAESAEKQMQLAALLEQCELVRGYIREASQQRKLDDTKALHANLSDLTAAVDRLRKELKM